MKLLKSKIGKEKLGYIRIHSHTFGKSLDYLLERDSVEIPFVVTRVGEYIRENHMDKAGLFRLPGRVNLISAMKREFDTKGDVELSDYSFKEIGNVLKHFLREMKEKTITRTVQLLFLRQPDEVRKHTRTTLVPLIPLILARLPAQNMKLFRYICELLIDVEKHQPEDRKMDFHNLSMCFVECLFEFGDRMQGLADQMYLSNVFQVILENYQEIFAPAVEPTTTPYPRSYLGYNEIIKYGVSPPPAIDYCYDGQHLYEEKFVESIETPAENKLLVPCVEAVRNETLKEDIVDIERISNSSTSISTLVSVESVVVPNEEPGCSTKPSRSTIATKISKVHSLYDKYRQKKPIEIARDIHEIYRITYI